MSISNYEIAMYDAAELACIKAAEFAGQRLQSLSGGISAFYPSVDLDNARFGVGIVEKYHYLVYQENGFSTFSMVALKGKTVPMVINGQLIFRKVSKVNEFRPGKKVYWRRNKDGELFPSGEQRRAWVHPGVPPKGFVTDAVKSAAVEKMNDIFRALMADLEG